MQYITTKCKNCGYRTRSFESNVPKVQLGMPIMKCPNCGSLILDSIATEYELMTDKEQMKFNTDEAMARSYVRNISLIILGIIFAAAGIVSGGAVAGLLIGAASAGIGIYQIVKNERLAKERVIELGVYKSLKRTSNSEYVRFLQSCYLKNGIKRHFNEYPSRQNFLDCNSKFESNEEYIRDMKIFEEIMAEISADNGVERDDTTTVDHH